jgi:hypothetical protein
LAALQNQILADRASAADRQHSISPDGRQLAAVTAEEGKGRFIEVCRVDRRQCVQSKFPDNLLVPEAGWTSPSYDAKSRRCDMWSVGPELRHLQWSCESATAHRESATAESAESP